MAVRLAVCFAVSLRKEGGEQIGNLPDFLIIGAQKSGTTWLYNSLQGHPKIKMSVDRKEVHFFDRYYDKGIDWYQNKFPAHWVGLVGEATPAYLYESNCPQRIAEVIPNAKLICILRNPVQRAYSHYKYLVQEKNCQQEFEQVIKTKPDILERGLYYQQLTNYLEFFPRKQLKVLIFEETINNKEQEIAEVFDFLDIASEFDLENLEQKANASRIPRFQTLYSAGKKLIRKMYDYDLVFIINFLKKIGLKKLFFSKQEHSGFPPLSDKMKLRLKKYYRSDVIKLEELLERDLKQIWNFN